MFAFVLVALVAAVPDAQVIERERVRAHLEGALRELRSVPASQFSDEVWGRRQQAIARLLRYTEAGRFPINDRYPFQTPLFVDDRGTRCAMGEVIDASGGSAFVAKVHRERNLARVRELVNEPALVEWLEVNGFTVAEAARVQPSYGPAWTCGAFRANCVCGLKGALGELSITSVDAESVTGALDRIWGDEPAPRQIVINGGLVTVPAARVGAAFTFKPYEQSSIPTLAVGRKVVVALNGDFTSWWPLVDGRVSCAFDSRCTAPASMALDQALEMAAKPCCEGWAAASGFGEPFCVPNGSGSYFQVCAVDGRQAAAFDVNDAGHWYELMCDAGISTNAQDAGVEAPAPPRNSGCSLTGQLSMLLAALMLRRRRLSA